MTEENTTQEAEVVEQIASQDLTIAEDQEFFTPAQSAVLVHLGLSGASRADVQMLFHAAKRTGLDPFSKQIQLIERRTKVHGEWVSKWTLQTNIDGFRLLRSRPGTFKGMEEHWCGEDGEWVDVWTAKTPPVAARIRLHLKGYKFPVTAVARYDEFVQLKNNEPTAMWAKMPTLMTSKVAEALAYRKAFPQDFSGIYTDDEMGQADNGTDEQAVVEEVKPSALPKQTKRATTGRQGTKRKTAAKVEEPAGEVAEVVAEVVPEPVADEVPEPATQPEPQPTAEDEERAERERIANEQMRQVSEREAVIATAADVDRADEAAVAAWNAEHGKATGHYITSDAEVQRQREKMNAEEPAAAPEPVEDEGPQWVDRDGTVYDSQAELDAAIRARVQGNIATDAGQVVGTIDANAKTFAEVVAEEPKNYAAQLEAATTQEECLAVWNAAQADDENPVTTEFKMEILRVKNSLTGDQA